MITDSLKVETQTLVMPIYKVILMLVEKKRRKRSVGADQIPLQRIKTREINDSQGMYRI